MVEIPCRVRIFFWRIFHFWMLIGYKHYIPKSTPYCLVIGKDCITRCPFLLTSKKCDTCAFLCVELGRRRVKVCGEY